MSTSPASQDLRSGQRRSWRDAAQDIARRASKDWEKASLPAPEVVYYALFFDAIGLHFFRGGLNLLFEAKFSDPWRFSFLDMLLLKGFHLLAVVALVSAVSLQLLRVYARVGISEREFARCYPALSYEQDDYLRGWYHRLVGSWVAYFVHAGALFYLIYLERVVIGGESEGAASIDQFLSLWGSRILPLYLLLLTYSVLVCGPRCFLSTNAIARSYAAGLFLTDLSMGGAWLLVTFVVGTFLTTSPIFAGVFLAASLALLVIAFQQEQRRPLGEPMRAYLRERSTLKSVFALLVLILAAHYGHDILGGH